MKAESPGETTRSRMLAAAAQEIRQIGPRRLTLSGVAGRLGLSHSAVYRHFADKPALIDAVLAGWLRALEGRLSEIADGPDPADDKLERFLTSLARAYADGARQEAWMFRLLADPPPRTEEPSRHARRVLELATRIAEEGIATRLFAAGGGDSRRAAQLALDLAHRFLSPPTVLSDAGEPGLDARRDRAIRGALRALTGRSGR